jgi:hypothetical protein
VVLQAGNVEWVQWHNVQLWDPCKIKGHCFAYCELAAS